MPVHVSIATALDKSKLASDVVYLVLLEIDILSDSSAGVVETLRFVHNNEDYDFQGHTYMSMPFEFQYTSARNELPSITLSVTDFQGIIQAYLQEYKGGVDWDVRLIITNNATTSADYIERFKIVSATASGSDYKISFQLGAENPLQQRFPPRLMFRDRCGWNYKSFQCGYTGSLPTCSFNLNGINGCKAHGNQKNFGGFPGIRHYTGG